MVSLRWWWDERKLIHLPRQAMDVACGVPQGPEDFQRSFRGGKVYALTAAKPTPLNHCKANSDGCLTGAHRLVRQVIAVTINKVPLEYIGAFKLPKASILNSRTRVEKLIVHY